MAFPRVFVSSTCYDLGEIRDSLSSFISSYYYEPILSERGDIFYHPDLHIHDSCLREIENCQFFILIIGGRFGGQYVADREKSIVNAEYQAAKQGSIPVFCFVKREVLDNHGLYERNKGNKNVISKIEFPSIEKQEYAPDIFEFINEVRHSPVNNGVFPFDFARDILEILGKQWAGMMFDFLLKRRANDELSVTTGLIANLTLASTKTEELLERVYKYLDKEKAEENIRQIDNEIEAKKFFQDVFRYYGIRKFESSSIDSLLSIDSQLPWYKFLEQTGEFEIEKNERIYLIGIPGESERTVDFLTQMETGMVMEIGGQMRKEEERRLKELTRFFESFKKLSVNQKKKLLADFV